MLPFYVLLKTTLAKLIHIVDLIESSLNTLLFTKFYKKANIANPVYYRKGHLTFIRKESP